MQSDPDLESLRKSTDLPIPARRKWERFRGRNGVEIPYRLLEPRVGQGRGEGAHGEDAHGEDAHGEDAHGEDAHGEDAHGATVTSRRESGSAAVPGAVVFGPASGGPSSSDWLEETFLAGAADRGWLVVVVRPPARGWYTHPTHHALEDLLRDVLERYEVEGGRFHAVAVGDGGGPAVTYAGMSDRYFGSLTTLSALVWTTQDEEDLARHARRGEPVCLVVGEKDAALVESAREMEAALRGRGVPITVIVRPGEGATLPGLHGGALFEGLDAILRPRG